MATLAQTFGLAPREENLDEILGLFTTAEQRLRAFQDQELQKAEADRAALAAIQASLEARTATIERAQRVEARLQAITE
jgi:hypothetical protein